VGRLEIDRERAAAVFLADPIAPIAEKNEAAADQPSQQVAQLDQLALRRGLLADFQRSRGHRFEIAGRLANLLEHLLEACGDLRGVVRHAAEAQFKMDEGLGPLGRALAFERDQAAAAVSGHGEHRMHQQAGAEAEVMKVFERAVDDERAVLHRRFGKAAGAVAARLDHDADLDPLGAEREKLEGLGGDLRAAFG